MTPNSSLVFKYVSDAIVYVDSSHRILALNPAAERLLRIKTQDAEGTDFWDLFAEARTEQADESIRSTLATKRPVKFDLFLPRRYIWTSILAVGDQDGLLMLIRDITDRVRLMHTEAVQEEVRAIIEVAPVAMSITRGSEHRTVMINKKARELIGEREVVGIPIRMAFPELEGQGLFEILDNVWKSGSAYTGSAVPVSYKPGDSDQMKLAYFDISYQPLFDTAGTIYGIMSVSVDVTGQIEMRKKLGAVTAE